MSVDSYRAITIDEFKEIDALPIEDRRLFLFLADHPKHERHWAVESDNNVWFRDFKDVLARRVVNPFTFDKFKERADLEGYQIRFIDDPSEHFEWAASLFEPPEVSINSDLEGTLQGMWPFQIQGYNFLKNLRGGVANWSTGPQPLDEPILTPDGWKSMGDISVGDKVMGSDGQPHSVTGVFPRGEDLVYEVRLSDGSYTRCCKNHLWTVYDRCGKKYTKTLDEIMQLGLFYNKSRGKAKWYLPRVRPIDFPERDLPIEPYLLGALLGDGSFTSNVTQFYSHEGELIPYIEPLIPNGMRISKYGPKHFGIVGDPYLKNKLRELDLWGHTASRKYIPDIYKNASRQQRIEILQGVLDTDGSAEKQSARIFTISPQLAYDVMDIVRSLGGRATSGYRAPRRNVIQDKEYNCAEGWVVNITLPPDIEPFRLIRKRIPVRPEVRRASLSSVTPVDRVNVQCISIDSSDHLYVTRDYILTHNTGKTVLACALTKYHRERKDYELALYVCKRKSKTNVQRSFAKLADLHGEVIKNVPGKRYRQYVEIAEQADAGEQPLLILNYEKFRDDEANLTELIDGRNIWIIFDEMPEKLKRRTSQLYRATARVLYTSASKKSTTTNWKSLRAAGMQSLMLSATPIVHSPMDFYNCVRLLDPDPLGTIDEFHTKFARTWSPFASGVVSSWKNLALLGEMAAQFTHQVDKEDPDVAKYFPEVLEDDTYLDMTPEHQALYDRLMSEYEADEDFDSANILAKITVAQRLLDHPELVIDSAIKHDEGLAAQYVNVVGKAMIHKAKSVKLEALEDIFNERRDQKGIVFSVYSDMLPYMARVADRVGLKYVVFQGGLSDRSMQEAQDAFTDDPECMLFLSSDAGGDSLDFPEAEYTVNYDLGWSWAGKRQRENRQNRIISTKLKQFVYNLYIPNSVEDRKREIIEKKYGYHKEIFKGTVSDLSEGARLSKGDLLYILTGRRSK